VADFGSPGLIGERRSGRGPTGRDPSRPAEARVGPAEAGRGEVGPHALGDGSGLDPANRAIIEALQRDGRRPYGSIAEEVGLSEAAVRRRVQRLRETGVLQIVAVTDPIQLGFTRQALVGIRVEGDIRRVADAVVALGEVDYVVICAGAFDVLAEVVCEDDDQLLRLLNDAIRTIPGVRSTETFLYLKLAKQTYTWGTR
jgi:Lrp/AsnC family transcriptional regulator for asnA, asnC and gidA